MSVENDVITRINQQRASQGFRGISELLALMDQGNTILDPFSLLISVSVILGENNLFYPNVIIQAKDGGKLQMGDGNVFYPNTLVLAEKGSVKIGNENQFGDGGCSVKANMADAEITISDNGRYINGVQVIGKTNLGSGSQVIGPITVQNSTLAAGGDYKSADADLRGGLLKGSGLARNVQVDQGGVINATGDFKQENLERQSKYHPKK